MFVASLCALVVALSSHTRGRDLARAGPEKPWSEYYAYEPFQDSEIEWIPIVSTLEAPTPLLVLALQRTVLASGRSQGKQIHLERPENFRVLEIRQESTGDVEKDADPNVDRWYKWIVVACYYEVDDTHGECGTFDVRARTAWNSGTAPTEWPVKVKFLGVENPRGAPPPTINFLSLGSL